MLDGGDAEGKAACVDELQPVGMQVQEDVSALGVRAMHERIDEQLAHYRLVIGGDVGAEKALRQLVALAEIGDLAPHGIDQLTRPSRPCRRTSWSTNTTSS